MIPSNCVPSQNTKICPSKDKNVHYHNYEGWQCDNFEAVKWIDNNPKLGIFSTEMPKVTKKYSEMVFIPVMGNKGQQQQGHKDVLPPPSTTPTSQPSIQGRKHRINAAYGIKLYLFF